MIPKYRITSSHILSSILACDSIRSPITQCMLYYESIHLFQQSLIKRMIQMAHHIVECTEMVRHLSTLQ